MMAAQKKKEFGLAAQLAQPRPAAPVVPPPDPQPEGPELSVTPDLPELTDEGPEAEITVAHSNHTERSKRTSERRKKVGAPPRAGGYVRRTITLAPSVSDYVDRAWRTHRTPEGKYVKGVSGFIEAIIEEHRKRGR
jgi:hypothetical protein